MIFFPQLSKLSFPTYITWHIIRPESITQNCCWSSTLYDLCRLWNVLTLHSYTDFSFKTYQRERNRTLMSENKDIHIKRVSRKYSQEANPHNQQAMRDQQTLSECSSQHLLRRSRGVFGRF